MDHPVRNLVLTVLMVVGALVVVNIAANTLEQAQIDRHIAAEQAAAPL